MSLGAGLLFGRAAARLWLALMFVASIAILVASAEVLCGAAPWEFQSTFRLAGQPVHLRLDAISAFFLALLAFVGAAASAYTRGYWSDREYPQTARSNRMWWTALLLTMGIVLLSANGLHFLIGWELFAVCSYFLITLDRTRREVRAAGWLYLAASHAGTLCLFAFFTLLATRTGSWELISLHDHPELASLFWVALAGFGVKAGLFPLHIWLPAAHANAPSHVSAIMSGVTIKLGIYGILRFSGLLPVPADAGWVLVSIGAVTALLGIAFSLAQNDLKRLLAYSSVENIGIILIGLGGGLLGISHADAAWGRVAFAGALLHIWNHGVFKSLLFFGAGSVLHATGTREMSRLGGLWRLMPWTATLFGLGAVAVSALPPLNGFVSEWLIYVGLFDAVTSHTSAAWVAVPAIVMLGMTGAIALASFTKASAMIFLGAPRSSAAIHAHEAGGWMRGPMLVGGAVALLLGLVPFLVWPALLRVAAAWQPSWNTTLAAAPLTTLRPVQIALAAAVLLGVLLLWWRVRRGGIERAPTWDCGYALPTARMQYTSGSFAGIVAGWFGWILLPEQELKRPRGAFPRGAYRMERTPETVLERGLGPIAAAIMKVSLAVRQLQHGRLQFYIAYVVAGLISLAALAAAGVKP